MEESMKEQLKELLPKEALLIWDELTEAVDSLYDVDRLWNKGFGDWEIEYKYRRGGKTLCTFYAKKDIANLLITYGKAEREKFEEIKESISKPLQDIYEKTESLHDGKWLWIPLDDKIVVMDIIAMLKIKRRPNRKEKTCRLLLFDLDGTLLRSDKSISDKTLSTLRQCREKGIMIGVSTSRSEQNSMTFLDELKPDILIASGGALIKSGSNYIYKAEFSEAETRDMIAMARTVCGEDCEITIDTAHANYWNYKIDPKKFDQSWGNSIYTDFANFSECALKMCVEIFDEEKANILAERLEQCDCIRFSDGYWYKFTRKNVTKENAIMRITEVYGFGTEAIIAFGDDFADIGMLELCGLGVAMGNAIDEVKNKADVVIGSNDEEGIAAFIEENLL